MIETPGSRRGQPEGSSPQPFVVRQSPAHPTEGSLIGAALEFQGADLTAQPLACLVPRPEAQDLKAIAKIRFDVMFRRLPFDNCNKLAFFRANSRHDSQRSAPPFMLALVNSQISVLVRRARAYDTIFTDPRPVQPGKWHRFDVALRFGSDQMGLAQVEHDGALVANYWGALG